MNQATFTAHPKRNWHEEKLSTIIDTIEEESTILLERALLGKQVGYFGIDGNGKYGSDIWAHYSTITGIDVTVTSASLQESTAGALVRIFLSDYSASANGHILTDSNFILSLNSHLKAAIIDPTCLEWGVLQVQGDDHVTFSLDIEKLLQW